MYYYHTWLDNIISFTSKSDNRCNQTPALTCHSAAALCWILKKNAALSYLMHLLEFIFMIHCMHLKLDKTCCVFWYFFYIWRVSFLWMCTPIFLLLNINTLIISLTHFLYLLDCVFVQKIHSWSQRKNSLCLTKNNRISYQILLR